MILGFVLLDFIDKPADNRRTRQTPFYRDVLRVFGLRCVIVQRLLGFFRRFPFTLFVSLIRLRFLFLKVCFSLLFLAFVTRFIRLFGFRFYLLVRLALVGLGFKFFDFFAAVSIVLLRLVVLLYFVEFLYEFVFILARLLVLFLLFVCLLVIV